MRTRSALAALAATLAIASCAPRPAPPAPVPAPQPAPQPPPPAPPPPPPSAADWRDAPLSEGDWSWQGDVAEYRGARAHFGLRCERDAQVLLVLTGVQAPALTVRTSYGERRLPANRAGSDEIVAALAVADPLLDEMAFSRGRIQIAPEDGEAVILPSWPEIARVIEDCRGA